MATFDTKSIRNLALLGHGACGKTSLTEAMLFLAGETQRLGKVADGNTVSDFDTEEQKRGFSISASVANLTWKNIKVNIIDTPGYPDFAGEVRQALRVAGSAVIVVDGKSGVEVGTDLAYQAATDAGVPKVSLSTSATITTITSTPRSAPSASISVTPSAPSLSPTVRMTRLL